MVLLIIEWDPPCWRRKEGGPRSTRCDSTQPPLYSTFRPWWLLRPWDVHPPPAWRHCPSHQRGKWHGEPSAGQPVHFYSHWAWGDWCRPRWVSCLVLYLIRVAGLDKMWEGSLYLKLNTFAWKRKHSTLYPMGDTNVSRFHCQCSFCFINIS